jgi:hypothetical protein
MNMHERTTLIDSLRQYLENNDNISFACLFGSFKDYHDSVGFRDIDIALYIIGVEDVFDFALGMATELSGEYNLPVECIPLNIAPVFLRYRIFKEGIILFCKDEKLMTDLMESTTNNALDFIPLREEAIRNLV